MVAADSQLLDYRLAGDRARLGSVAVAFLVPVQTEKIGRRPVTGRGGRGGGPIGPVRQRLTRSRTRWADSSLMSRWSSSPARSCVEPRGGIARSSRTMTLTSASRGRPRSRTRRVGDRVAGGDRVLEHLGAEPPDRAGLRERARSAGSLRRQAVADGRRSRTSIPAATVETRTAKKTILKNCRLWGTCSMTGKVASTTGTAPRRPAHTEDHPFAPAVGERQRRDCHRDRPGEDTSTNARTVPLTATGGELGREDQQAEGEEHRHLGHPSQALVKAYDRPLGGNVRRAEHEPGEVHREEAGAVQGVGAAVGERRDGQ